MENWSTRIFSGWGFAAEKIAALLLTVKYLMIHSLWPTHVLELELAHGEWLAAAKVLLPDLAVIDSYTGVRPWATAFDLHRHTPWDRFSNSIVDITAEYLTAQGLRYRSIWMEELWVNAQMQSQNHIMHTHPNSWYSGVFYLQCPEGSQRLLFTDPRPQASVNRLLGSAQTWAHEPRAGDLLTWPSWLQHQTVSWTRQELAEPRISVSWNLCVESDRTG